MSVEHRKYVTFGSAARPFPLLGGEALPEVTIAYETWGHLSASGDNLVLITTGLSASSHVAKHSPDDEPGWWDAMVGPGRAIDTDRWCVVCTNVLGGCFGSTGPTSLNPRTGQPYAADFPTVSVEDMVEAQVPVLDHLGVERARMVIGSSLGGMLALQWGALFPERVASICGIATPGRAYAFSIGWRAVQRAVVMGDPAFLGGRYAPGEGPRRALSAARAIGILSYRSPAEFDPRFGRDTEDGMPPERGGRFTVESYLQHNAAKFGERFDANSYLRLARAMDLFDLGRGAASYENGVARITAPCLIVGFTSDLLFPIAQQREVADILRASGRPVRLVELETAHGHDAFLIETGRLGTIVAGFLESVGHPGGG